MSHLFSSSSSRKKHKHPPDRDEDNTKINQDLQSYLEQHYISTPSSKKKKKRRKERNSSLRIVDKDVSGFHAMEEAPVMEGLDPEGPSVVNEAEVAAAKRFHEKQRNKKYYGEGGWRTIEEEPPAPDLSPPRKPREEPPAPDLSPPRKPREEPLAPDLSPSRKPREESLVPDLSPSRKPREEPAAPDLSPPRDHGLDRKRRMMDGSRSGVVTAEQMREELRKKRKEDKERIYRMEDDVTGRGAQTIYRNKQGQRVSLEELKKAEEQEGKRKVKWEKVEWDSGLAQQRELKRQKGELAKQVVKPFARTRDDEDLDAMYRARVHWGDPMSHLAKKQKTPHSKPHHELTPVIDETNRHWFEKSGFVVPQDVPEHSWIRRGVAPLSNRYGIKPGRHWDGVDRSNGFEKEYIRHMNEQRAKDREAAMWTMEDM